MNEVLVTNKNAGRINVIHGKNPRNLYEHQVEAMLSLNTIDKKKNFSSLLVLPTGGGKTLTAVWWLLKNAVDKGKKVLWIAHRHLLLEQAAEAFSKNSFSDICINESSFNYRIVSGQHDKPIHIKSADDVLIVSKDSIIRNLHLLGKWLKDTDDLYFIIDEAHHAAAKSYRRIIEFVKSNVKNVRILGLTATPFRTSEQEQGLLGKIFTDDISYKIDLDTLIKKGILSIPVCESCDTDSMLGESLGLNAIKSIEQLDIIPDDIAEIIASNKERNRFIVNQFFKNDNFKKYGQTIVFALNRTHAFTLKALFEQYGKKHGIKAGVIVSGTRAEFIGIEISNEENERQIEAFRKGEIQVLINVNILTEGVDLPKTQTVFLTRPTVSTVLMTQMVGRALRGEKAGGTKEAYIVSFVDNWNNKIAWVNPESILSTEPIYHEDKEFEYKKRDIRMISIDKIEEFARIIDETVDTRALESLDFIKRIPLGMYSFSFIDENNLERNHQILVYDSTKDNYRKLIDDLPALFSEYGIDEEVIPEDILNELMHMSETAYFSNDMIPAYNKKDIEYLLKFFAQKECEPLFITFDEIDRKKVDLSDLARTVVEKDMRESEKKKWFDELWEDEKSLIRIYYGNRLFFKRQLQTEIDKLYGDFEYAVPEDNIDGEPVDLSRYSINEICEIYPSYGHKLKEEIYYKAKDECGNYTCGICGKKSPAKGIFQIDHIIPISKGGLTVPDNLQLLCRRCNQIKGDKYEA